MKHFFNDALTIYNSSSRDEYGRESWGTGTAVMGRFVETSTTYKNPKGEVVVADALVHVDADTDISVGSKVVFDSVNYYVVKVVKPKDISAVRFIKALLAETIE